jgi:hypothetical protein
MSMALELNEEQLEIMREVRKNLIAISDEAEVREVSQYICVQILRVLSNRAGLGNITNPKDLPSDSLRFFRTLGAAISQALNGCTSVGIYLSRLREQIDLEIYDGMDAIFNYHAPLARLAWLDRMIETKVIA